MAVLTRWFLALTMLLAAGLRLWAASPADRAFDTVYKGFQDGSYEWAEAGLADFCQKFPTSPRLAEAILLQAEARIKLTNYDGAIGLLAAHQKEAGTNADQYQFWLAEAAWGKGDYRAASDGFARVVKDFPASSRLLEAVMGEASARAALARAEPAEWPRVIELLQRTNGVFQGAARTNAGHELVVRGQLLLSEAQLATKDYTAADATLQPLGQRLLSPKLAWQWQYLLCRIQLAEGQTNAALQSTTNLLAAAANAAQTNLLAESAAFQAGLFERLGQTNAAIAAYRKNLAEGAPAERQRQALLKIAELCPPQATQMLETFLSQYPEGAAADLALLTLGELRLRQYEAGVDTNQLANATTNTPAATNSLQLALASFNGLTKRFPQSPLFGKAQLDLGLCYWRDGNLPKAQAAFQLAVERLECLPASLELGSAYLRLADTQLQQGEFTNAIRNYQAIIDKLAALPEARTNLFEHALSQTVRAGVDGGCLADATNSLQKMRTWYPNSLITAHAVLLIAQAISDRGEPARARTMLQEFAQSLPDAPLLPERRLAIAGTYVRDNQCTNAIEQYDRWLREFTNSGALLPQAEYYRAQATSLAGQETNALMRFTNFIAQFPTSEFAPRAQLWVADYYYGARNWTNAELNYKLLSQSTNWPPSDLTYEAQLMAGLAAAARQGWPDAKADFIGLYENTNCPSLDLRLQALLEYGETLMRSVDPADTNRLANWEQATLVFDRIGDQYPTNRQAVPAWNDKANCYLQWALVRQQYDSLTNALNAYQHAIDSPQADVAARSEAKVGQATVLAKWAEQKAGAEQTALLKQALSNCLDVFYGKFLRDDNEKVDPFWTKEAGMRAFDLAYDLQAWSQAVNLYLRLQTLWPQMPAALAKKGRKAMENLEREKTSR